MDINDSIYEEKYVRNIINNIKILIILIEI